MTTIKTIGFDADDTLWINENYYAAAEKAFGEVMTPYLPAEDAITIFSDTEIGNLQLFGYGAKGFTLSMMESALKISQGELTALETERILQIGKELILRPVSLLENVQEVLEGLKGKYQLIVVTKGDLLDQERKLKNSLLIPYFRHVEIMSEKTPEDYKTLLKHLSIRPEEFVMIGNSLKSDILPVLAIGARAIYIPYHTTGKHEYAPEPENPTYHKVENIREVLDILL